MEMITKDKTPQAAGPLNTARPLLSLVFAAAVLDCSRYQLLERIEARRIPLAFDIAAPRARRSCLRLSTASVRAVSAGLKPPSDLQQFLETAFPPGEPFYKPPRMARLLECDHDHIYHLVKEGELADAGNDTCYLIPRQSVLDFLAKRRVA